MIQQINLYNESFRKKKVKFSINVTLAASVALFATIAMYSAVQGWQLVKLKTQLRQIEAKHTDLLKQKDSLVVVVSKPPNEELLQRIKQKESELSDKKSKQDLIAGYILEARGYSDYFVALANNHIKNFWLTAIYINDGGREISIKGKTLDGPSLPTYMKRISDDSVFQKVSLNIFKLQRELDEKAIEQNYLDFEIGNISIEPTK